MQKTSLLEKVREMCRIAVGRVNTFVVSKLNKFPKFFKREIRGISHETY